MIDKSVQNEIWRVDVFLYDSQNYGKIILEYDDYLIEKNLGGIIMVKFIK